MILNILITSAGLRAKLIRYFKNHFTKVVAADCDQLAPALFFSDKHYIVPHITSSDYFEVIKGICIKEEIDGILSLTDPEQQFLSGKNKELEEIGVKFIGSSKEVCDLCFDKWKMHHFLKQNNFKTPKSYINLSSFMEDYLNKNISFPVFIKPITGSGSTYAQKISNLGLLESIFKSREGLIIQSYIKGREYGIDAYIDINSGEITSIFSKNKIKMRAGETDKSVSFTDDKVFSLVKDLIKKLGVSGPIDIDIFETDEELYILEVNPRFGGGYPHAYECGENFPKMILENLKKKSLPSSIGGYKDNTFMMKYYEIKVIH